MSKAGESMIKVKKLDCGITLIMENIPYVQSASLGIWSKTGSVDETKKYAGISHLIEHMIFKGTEKRSAKQIAEDVDKIGSHINAFTGKEATCYYIKTLASNIDKSIEILLDMFLNSVFAKNELEKEKHVIYEEMKMIEDSPEDDIHDIICELVFKGDPLSQTIIGTKSSLSRITGDSIKKYIFNEYTRNSVVISVAGKFNEEHLVKLIGGKLSGLNEAKSKKTCEYNPYTTSFKVKVKDIEQAHVCLGTRGVKLDDKNYYAFTVLNNIFGGTMSARLFQSIREDKGLAYSVYSASNSFIDMGVFSIYAAVSHDKARETVIAVRDELMKLKKDGISEDELSAAKEQLKGSYIFSQESVSGRMFSIGKNMTLLGKIFTPEEVIAGIDKVTRDDIEEVSEQINRFENYSAVLITNRRADLSKWMKEQ